MKTIKWINTTVGTARWLVVLLSLQKSLLALCGIGYALFMRRIIDDAASGNQAGFVRWAAVLGGVILLQLLIQAAARFCLEESTSAVTNKLRQAVFHGIMTQDYRTAASCHTGELMNRITSDVTAVSDGVTALIPDVISMVLRVIGILAVLYQVEKRLAVLLVIGGGILTALSFFPRKLMKKLYHRVQEQEGKVRCLIQECLESLLIIHCFQCEEKMEKEAGKQMGIQRMVRRRRGAFANLFNTGLNAAMQWGYLLGAVWCGWGILQGPLSYGTMMAVLQLIGQIQAPFVNLGNAFPKWTAMTASGERLMELTLHLQQSEQPSVRLSEKQRALYSSLTREEIYQQMESISFEQVSFQYKSGRQVLEQESFQIRKGEVVAMTGSSGIGKSTIMKLLLSVYEPDSGRIVLRFNHADESGQIPSIPVSQLPPGIFAYVPQGNCLMSGTIREVVGFSQQAGAIDQRDVEEACRIACAHEFIQLLPDGYDTVLGERGAGLSEGQMQRLAVARAIYSRCPILLLDEATSALDGETEGRLMNALRALPDRTILIVTHRADTWKRCDRVLTQSEGLGRREL
ncbi:MAG: ABC transporter ATP-binding protein [Lachnospiraceae bacterium]|nr:ABC transporter ATP-binding protein [Lachnospiraceae bacterium]